MLDFKTYLNKAKQVGRIFFESDIIMDRITR